MFNRKGRTQWRLQDGGELGRQLMGARICGRDEQERPGRGQGRKAWEVIHGHELSFGFLRRNAHRAPIPRGATMPARLARGRDEACPRLKYGWCGCARARAAGSARTGRAGGTGMQRGGRTPCQPDGAGHVRAGGLHTPDVRCAQPKIGQRSVADACSGRAAALVGAVVRTHKGVHTVSRQLKCSSSATKKPGERISSRCRL